jgi:hypothetical protein
MSRPASAANAASSVFHSRSREPLDPPVISSRDACGYAARPGPCHQDRIEATANAPVSDGLTSTSAITGDDTAGEFQNSLRIRHELDPGC